MLCDPCLMLLYKSFKDDENIQKVFFALAREDFPTHDTLIQETGLTLHRVRDALNFLRGAGLVWGRVRQGLRTLPHGLSEGGLRLLELLRDSEGTGHGRDSVPCPYPAPEPSEVLCDDCLLEIGELLLADGYTVLAHLSGFDVSSTERRRVLGRHDLLIGTELTVSRLRDALVTLEGAQLIRSARGRAFCLSETGRRLERLLRSRAISHQTLASSVEPLSAISYQPSAISHQPFRRSQ